MDVSKICWDSIGDVDDLDDEAKLFNSFGQVVESNAPTKEMNFKHKGNPCITLALMEEMKLRDQLLTRARYAGKICERIALELFTDYLKEKDLLTGHQSGNKSNHSTETLNILVSDFVLNTMD
ncbi:Hypothetical predicted protein, partial [Paramuricea clavata]